MAKKTAWDGDTKELNDTMDLDPDSLYPIAPQITQPQEETSINLPYSSSSTSATPPLPITPNSKYFSRWLIPISALCIHLSIGQAYAFSVFNKPLTRLLGINKSLSTDFTLVQVGWIFSIAIVMLGLTAAICGKWLERVGPRKAMLVSAIFFPLGFYLSAIAAKYHQLWLLYIGYGFIGGIGLGIGYISPVSTLIKWFPDRPGFATGMAIMGFGGGAMIGSPLAVELMARFSTPTSNGVWQTFVIMGSIYLVLMLCGAAIVRPPPLQTQQAISTIQMQGGVLVGDAMKTYQFYLLWGVLLFNVTAGIGILGQASNMIQDIYPQVTTLEAANFVVMLSGLNMAGRFFWSSLSDYLGRKPVYAIYFILGAILFGCVTKIHNSIPLFKFVCCIIMTMYGGGFATLPAYITDLYGRIHVSAIHGRILTAWSAAGLAGPNLMTYIRDSQTSHGVSVSNSYNIVLYVMCGLLGLGGICNFLIFPLQNNNNNTISLNQNGTQNGTHHENGNYHQTPIEMRENENETNEDPQEFEAHDFS